MGAEVSKVSRICGKKKGPKTPGSADPNTNDPVDEEFMEDFDDGGLIEKNRDNYFHKEDVERIAKKFENYKEWMDQSLSSSRKPSIRQKKMKWKEGEIIGTGSYGRVILGLNLQTGSIMAVKQVQVGNANTQSQQERIKALEIEIDLLSQLSHKNIVRYYGSHQSKTTFNIFLEYISGGTIASLIEKYGPLNENLARVYTRQILEGLEYLHVRNTIHRDIKGANVLVDNSGICKLADFGTAKRISSIVESELRYMPSIKGTVNWMAPEVIKQTSLGRQSDIWSVGCTLLEMVTGKIPWAHLMRPGATQVSALYQIASAKTHPPLPEGLSPETVDFLKQCFKINPQDRPNVVKLLNHKFIAGESPERPLETPDKQRSITSRSHFPPSSARHKKAESISSKLGDKLEGSKHISAFSRQRFDTHRDHLGGTEESEPIMISSPGGREEKKTARDPDRRHQMSARETKKEMDRLRSSKYTFNTEEQERIKSPSLAPVKSNNGILPSLPDDNPSNVYLISRPDSFLEDNLLKRERIMSDPEYVNLITDNANNDSHHIVRTHGQTARDTQVTDPNSPPNNGRLRTRDFEQKRNLEPLNLNKKLRTRPLGKNETAKRGSLGGKDDESSNILLSLGDIVKNQASGQDTSGLHLRSKSNFGLTSRALQPSNTALEEQKPDSPVVEEKKNEAHKRLGTLGLETPRYLETEPRQPTKGGSRVLEARESEPTPRLAFNNKTLMNSKTTGHSNGGLEIATHRQTAATHRGIVTHRDANDTSSDRSTLARLRFGKHPPEKKISIKIKEVLMDNDTELNMESYDKDNRGAEPNFTGIPVAGSVILDKVMEKDGQKDGQETKRVKAA